MPILPPPPNIFATFFQENSTSPFEVLKTRHSRKHRRASKEDGGAEREAEPPSLASLRHEIEANRSELLAMALQQNGCR